MRKVFFFIILMGIIMSLSSQTAVMPKGKGTKESPYLIATWQNLYWISRRTDVDIHYTKKMSAVYKQVNDISFPENTKKWSYKYALEPIGYYYNNTLGYEFSGEYDGQNYNISGVYINCPDEDHIGLFGIIKSGRIKNIRLLNAKIIGKSYVGALAGSIDQYELDNDITISNCYVEGYIHGEDYVGALFGSVGGYNIEDCRSKAQVEGVNVVGGLIGEGYQSVEKCSSYSDVNGVSDVGGLTGRYSGLIKDSYSQGNVTGDEKVAGLTASDAYSKLLIVNSYSLAKVNAKKNAGGLVALNHLTAFTNSYYKASIMNCSNEVENSGELSDSDFDKWMITLPSKSNFNLSKNNNGEYMIRSIEDLKMLDYGILSKGYAFILMNDLDLKNEKNFMLPKFVGSFNGNNKTIKNLTIDLPNESLIGLFRDVHHAKIYNLTIDQANIKGKDYVSVLAGNVGSGSEITNCTITGNISGNKFVALITGECKGRVENCKTYGTVKGLAYVAGMISRVLDDDDFDKDHTFSFLTNYASVDSEEDASGIFISVWGGVIDRCVNYGSISAKQDASGIIIFVEELYHTASIYNSGNYGKISSREASSGIALSFSGIIKDCYNYGDVSSNNIACGILVGWNCHIINTFNEGFINAKNIYAPITIDLREFAELFEPLRYLSDSIESETKLENTYYNYEKVKVNGKKIISLGAINNEQYNHWKKNKLNLNIDDYLKKNKKGVYLIESFEDFEKMLPFIYGDYSFILQNDIDLKKHENFHIPYFQNTFDGNYKSISNLNLNDPNMFIQGLFACVKNAEIRNLTIKDANVSAQECSGLLSGYIIDSSIQGIKCHGVTKSKSASGGISAHIERTSILNCSANASSSGETFVGGLFGLSIDSEISNVSFNGTVKGNSQNIKYKYYDIASGGLIGWAYGTRIKNAYAISSISGCNQGSICGIFSNSSLINSYSIMNNENKDFSGLFAISNDLTDEDWESFTRKSQITENEVGTQKNNYINCPDKMKPQIKNGIYKTKAQLKNTALYKEAKWDFKIWGFDPKVNDGYPYLK